MSTSNLLPKHPPTRYFFSLFFFFFNDTATTEIYTLSLHDALPICSGTSARPPSRRRWSCSSPRATRPARRPSAPASRKQGWTTVTASTTRSKQLVSSFAATDRKSTRLNSSHLGISYAVFCLKKKKE